MEIGHRDAELRLLTDALRKQSIRKGLEVDEAQFAAEARRIWEDLEWARLVYEIQVGDLEVRFVAAKERIQQELERRRAQQDSTDARG